MKVLRAVAMLTLAAACGPTEQTAAPEIRPVRVVTVEKREGGDTVSLTGTVQAATTVNLAFRIDGRMTERLVNVGDRLTPGETSAYLLACALLPITALLTFKSSVLQGLTRVVQAQAPGMLIRPLLFGLGVLVLAAGFGVRMTAGLAVGANRPISMSMF